MIKNDEELETAEEDSDYFLSLTGATPAMWSLVDLASRLRERAVDYTLVRDGFKKHFPVESLDDIGRALVYARIARGMSTNALANRLGIGVTEVERHEDTEYEKAELWVVAEVADALGLSFHGLFFKS